MSPRGVSWADRQFARLPLLARRGLAFVHDFWITSLVLLACALLVLTAYQQHELANQSHDTAVAAAGTAVAARRLAVENRRLVGEIQRSRVESCRRTYEGVRQIFRPFIPPVKVETPKQRRDRFKFNRRIDRLKARCPRQTAPR